MSKNINVSDKNYEWLLLLSIAKQQKEKRKVSMNDVLTDLRSEYVKREM